MLIDQQEEQELRPLYKQRLGIYPAGAETLIVPTLDMWRVHEASKLSAIAKRTDLSQSTFYVWKTQYEGSKPGVIEWLYGGLRPGDFHPTREMFAFRKAACMKSAGGIASSALRPDGSHVAAGVIRTWLKQYRQVEWFREWLIRGHDPLTDVRLVSAEQVARVSKGLDYVRHCQRAGLKVGDNYAHWLAERKITTVEWLLWLYGAQPPSGAFVITPGLQRLRQEQTPTAICKAAGIDYSTFRKAKTKREVTRGARGGEGGRRTSRPPIPRSRWPRSGPRDLALDLGVC